MWVLKSFYQGKELFFGNCLTKRFGLVMVENSSSPETRGGKQLSQVLTAPLSQTPEILTTILTGKTLVLLECWVTGL